MVSLASSLSKAVAAVSRPEYTGDDRCWPCTALNLGIVAVGAAVVRRRSRLGAVALAVAGLAAVALRGYVVPYTPRFAPALLAALPVDVGGSEPDAFDASGVAGVETDGADTGATDGEAVLGALVDAGIVRGDAEIRLDESFREKWRTTMETVRESDLETEIEATIPGVTAERYEWRGEDWYSLERTSGDGASSALSRQVAVADVAAVQTMTDHGLAPDVACRATEPLRQFLTACPVCDGALAVRDDSCCGGFGPNGPSEVLACVDCDARVFAFPD